MRHPPKGRGGRAKSRCAKTLIALFAWIALTVPALAADDAADRQRQEDLLATLEQIVSLDFAETPLTDVLAWARDGFSINLVVDRQVREAMAADPLPVTLKLREVSLRVALKMILRSHDLKGKIRQGILFVVPLDDTAGDDLASRVYDVRDLMAPLTDFPGPDLTLVAPEGSAGGPGAGFSPSPQTPPPMDPEFLIDLIRKNTGGDSWEKNPRVSVSLTNGLLIVVQTSAVHLEILKLISLLRQNR